MPVLDKPKHEKFCVLHVVEGMNAGDAYVAAGYARNDGNCIRFKQLPHIQQRMRELREEIASRAILGKAELLLHLEPQITGDLRRLFNVDGSLKAIHELTEAEAAMLQAFEVDTLASSDPKAEGEHGKKVVLATTKIKRADRRAAAETYARIAGYLKDKVELTGANGGPIQTKNFGQMTRTEKLEIARSVAWILSEGKRAAMAE